MHEPIFPFVAGVDAVYMAGICWVPYTTVVNSTIFSGAYSTVSRLSVGSNDDLVGSNDDLVGDAEAHWTRLHRD